MTCRKLSIFFVTLLMAGILAAPAQAQSKIDIAVRAVLASQDPVYLDPRLSDLVEELQSVFRYSSYRLLSEKRLDLALKETGMVSLPGDRILKIRPVQMAGNRVELELVIFKKDKEIFQTVTQLLNHSSIIVGGPEYKDGYLLFNISAAF